MFKKTKHKIIISIFLILLFVFTSTLALIYITSYNEIYKKSLAMLELYSKAYEENGNPDSLTYEAPSDNTELLPATPAQNQDTDLFYDASSFYSVAYSSNGDLLEIDNDGSLGVSSEELEEIGLLLIEKGKIQGTEGSWTYLIKNYDDYTLVALMDNTVTTESFTTLYHKTFLFGGFLALILLLPSILIANLIVRPLEKNDKKQKRFISDAGHELKTPISVIKANSEVLEKEIGQNKWLMNIRYETLQMQELIQSLLSLTYLENNILPMSLLNLSHVVKGSVLPFESVAYEKNITLKINISDQLYIKGNENQIIQLVSILLDNAIEYSPAKEEIRITLISRNHHCILVFSNKGELIPSDKREQLFDRFFRMDQTRERSNDHSGLGLSIAKTIVSSHHGKISVDCSQDRILLTVILPLKNKK